MDKGYRKLIIMIIICAYLIFTGVRVVHNYLPEDSKWYLFAGLAFIGVGVLALQAYVRRIWALYKGDKHDDDDET